MSLCCLTKTAYKLVGWGFFLILWLPAVRSDPAPLTCSPKMMEDDCRPAVINAAAFCLPQLAPLSTAEFLPLAQQKTGSCSTVCLPGAAADSKGRSPWHWNILKLSWTTLIYTYSLPLSEKCEVGRNSHRSFIQGLARIIWQGYRCFDNLTSDLFMSLQ